MPFQRIASAAKHACGAPTCRLSRNVPHVVVEPPCLGLGHTITVEAWFTPWIRVMSHSSSRMTVALRLSPIRTTDNSSMKVTFFSPFFQYAQQHVTNCPECSQSNRSHHHEIRVIIQFGCCHSSCMPCASVALHGLSCCPPAIQNQNTTSGDCNACFYLTQRQV
jgi:hypothetical protein